MKSKWKATRALSKIVKACGSRIPGNPLSEKTLTLKNIRRNLPKYIKSALAGAECSGMDICGDILRARIDISGAVLEVFSDSFGGRLFNPPVRLVDVSGEWDFGKLAGFKENLGKCGSTVGVWERLGLIGEDFALTRRGKIFSFFSKGEGLAIAAALEDASYAIEDISFDIANLRAGRRFALSEIKAESSTRMADLCRIATFGATLKGYLRGGVPTEYGAGASEIVREIRGGRSAQSFETPTLSRGDIERAILEWESLMRCIVFAPDIDWDRWENLKIECEKLLSAPAFGVKKNRWRAD